ncbi:MAG: phosphate acyltransferase [candidate division Zixibacteria bacterium]|nr:phosphate acyltransferase [candidate division Zixibacteria bacterium]
MNSIKSFADLLGAAKKKIGIQNVPLLAVLSPLEPKHIEAAAKAAKEGLVKPCFVGDKKKIEKLVTPSNSDISSYEIIESKSPLADGITLVNERGADFLLAAGIGRQEFSELLTKSGGIFAMGESPVLASLFRVNGYHKLIASADGVALQPFDAAQMIKIIENAASLFRLMDIATPKVALLAAVEAISPSIPVTMMEAAIAKMGDRGQIKNVLIDGPLSFDCAISAEVAGHKGIKNSPVAGDADILIPPTIETADGIYKAMVLYAKAESASVIYGCKAPISLTFEIDSVQNIVNSIVLGVIAFLK